MVKSASEGIPNLGFGIRDSGFGFRVSGIGVGERMVNLGVGSGVRFEDQARRVYRVKRHSIASASDAVPCP